jgi:hypothetical protein
VTETDRPLYVTCSNGHDTRKIAKILPRIDFNDIFGEKTTKKPSNAGMLDLRFLQLIWVNTPHTQNLRDPADMPSGTTDLDRKSLVICWKNDCQHKVWVSEGKMRRLVYEPATRRGCTSLDIGELESMLNSIGK